MSTVDNRTCRARNNEPAAGISGAPPQQRPGEPQEHYRRSTPRIDLGSAPGGCTPGAPREHPGSSFLAVFEHPGNTPGAPREQFSCTPGAPEPAQNFGEKLARALLKWRVAKCKTEKKLLENWPECKTKTKNQLENCCL